MTISDQQLALNKELHQVNPAFGNRNQASGMAAQLPLAVQRMHEMGLCSSVLDYGTGKGLLVERLRLELPENMSIDGYDPAVKKWSSKPNSPYDILLCLDVLEHVEGNTINSVIEDISSMTRHFCYIVIDLQPAVKKLSNGRNAHILLAPVDWWVSRFSQTFPCLTTFTLPHENGWIQKLAIVASHDPKCLPYINTFLNKLNVYDLCFKGGISKK